MDKILMENLSFYGYHGVLPEERTLGQTFLIDAVLSLSLRQAGQTDDLRFTADYGAVYARIREIVTTERFALIEALAERICREIFDFCPLVRTVRLRVRKPRAPVAGSFDAFGVELVRRRRDYD